MVTVWLLYRVLRWIIHWCFIDYCIDYQDYFVTILSVYYFYNYTCDNGVTSILSDIFDNLLKMYSLNKGWDIWGVSCMNISYKFMISEAIGQLRLICSLFRCGKPRIYILSSTNYYFIICNIYKAFVLLWTLPVRISYLYIRIWRLQTSDS